jgi:hypothetical protein
MDMTLAKINEFPIVERAPEKLCTRATAIWWDSFSNGMLVVGLVVVVVVVVAAVCKDFCSQGWTRLRYFQLQQNSDVLLETFTVRTGTN